MVKRSRRGCRECKRSRIKCDEAWPHCGTCRRRDRLCPGYAAPADRHAEAEGIDPDVSRTPEFGEKISVGTGDAGTPSAHLDLYTAVRRPCFSYEIIDRPKELFSTPRIQFSSMSLPVIPGYGESDLSDQVAINYYFQHHLRQVGLGDEFVEDGNAKVLVLLQQYPDIIGDIVFAIGHTHVSHIDSKSLVPALTRKSKALAKLRDSDAAQRDLEPKLLLVLGIGALELLDTASIPQMSSIPALLAYAAHMVTDHIETCAALGELAKYFLRALARQDMIFGLTYRRRNLIPTGLWFDDNCLSGVDRFLGLTMSLMPLLEELCCVAEEVKRKNHQQQLQEIRPQIELYDGSLVHQDDIHNSEITLATLSSDSVASLGDEDRVRSLRDRISMWRPSLNDGMSSFLEKRKYLLQAQAFRSAALLYLHRLCHPAGLSPESDAAAINMAYDILLSCHEDDADVRMILWPLFVSGCEVKGDSDRQLVLKLLDRNHRARGTYTPLKATKFLVECLWPAVDSGNMCCNWMDLVENFPGDFAPL